MNKQSIQDVDAKLEELHRKLMRTVNAIDALRAKRKKMVTGKIKVPPPPGIKVKFNTSKLTADEFGDLIPSFGSTPMIGG